MYAYTYIDMYMHVNYVIYAYKDKPFYDFIAGDGGFSAVVCI
jgi:hypothetical protein